MPQRNCDICNKVCDPCDGKFCEAGHFVCKDCATEEVSSGTGASCPTCRNSSRAEENKMPAELLSNWFSQYMASPKIQTTVAGIQAADGNSQTSFWLLFRRPDGVDVQIQLAARPSQPHSTIVAKIFEGRTDEEMARRIGSWVDEQTAGAPQRRSTGMTTFHPPPKPTEDAPQAELIPPAEPAGVSVEHSSSPSKGISKLIRVVASDGQKSVDLFFVRRQNDDLYYGATRDYEKFSYHASGKQHLTGKTGAKRQKSKHVPLSKIEGYYHLITVGYNIHALLDDWTDQYVYSGKRSDALVYLDARSIPKGFVKVSVGLLEAGKFDRVPLIDEPAMLDHQVTLFTGMKPWLCVRVAWHP